MRLQLLEVADEVQHAIEHRLPAVALESTLVAHGLPWPDNLEVGRALEAEVRRAGAVPATIAVVQGHLRIGIDGVTLEQLARGPPEWPKAGISDLPLFMARGRSAATTVSATVFAAARAGMRIMATGGIGGVHRSATMDVSSDLISLAREPVAVVSSGAKAILDLPRTLEALETLGVLVLGVRTGEFPSFYSRSSGLPLEHQVDSAPEAAEVLRTRWALGLGGVLLAHPIPEADELEANEVEAAIADALKQAQGAGIHGKALTPYLLACIERRTGGRSTRANRALAISNASFAAEVASALARLEPEA